MPPLQKLHHEFCRYLLVERNLSPATVKGHKDVFRTLVKRTKINDARELTLATFRQFFYEGSETYCW